MTRCKSKLQRDGIELLGLGIILVLLEFEVLALDKVCA
jgi:hypothetical protein